MKKVVKALRLAYAYALAWVTMLFAPVLSKRLYEFLLSSTLRNTPVFIGKQSRIMRNLASNWIAKNLDFPEVKGSGVSNIALVYDVIKSGPMYSHDGSIVSHAAILASNEEVRSVNIFVTHESALFGSIVFNKNKGPKTEQAVVDKINALPISIKEKITVNYFVCTKPRGLYQVCQSIISNNPDVLVFNSGLDNESRLVRSAFYRRLPVARTMTQSNIIPDKEVDLLLAKINDKKFTDLCKKHGVPFEYVLYPRRDLKIIDPLKEASIRTEGLKFITALTGKRIQSVMFGYSKSDLELLLSILDFIDGSSWTLIGEDLVGGLRGINSKLDSLIFEGKVILKEPVKNLSEIIASSDLYLNIPGITGGGYTCLMARNLGVPVVTDGYSDVANKQPRSFISDSGSMKEFFELTRLLSLNSNARKLFFREHNCIARNMPHFEADFYNALIKAKENHVKGLAWYLKNGKGATPNGYATPSPGSELEDC